MSTAKTAAKVPELRRAVRQAADDAFLVEPRVVRRIIRELHGFARLSARIPHTDVLVAKAVDVRTYSHPDELGLEDFRDLPALSVLVAQPEEYELEAKPLQDLMQLVWSRLFHGMIDLRLQEMFNARSSARLEIQDRIDRLGQVEFDEAHNVLKSELRLMNPESHIEAYLEFVATYLQLCRFSPDLLPIWFPSLADESEVLPILREHFDADLLFNSTQLYGATAPDLIPGTTKDEASVAVERQSWTDDFALKPSARRYARLMRSRRRWGDRGNTVAAAVTAMRAVNAATTDDERTVASSAALEETNVLADRLQTALTFHERDLDAWRESLWELVQNSTLGFWNSDKKLLYDLQKVCLDHERTIYQVDLVKWIMSRGKRDLRRPLTNTREVMMAKHLVSSASRLVYVRLSGPEREQLSRLLHEAKDLAEEQMRSRMRSAIHETILEVGLQPKSVPEKVALDKMVEESLDCIAERGYLTMGYLRDAISRNDLKLPDLTDPKDLVRGDHLLRTDDRLDVSLDGVYRRGEFYLRWLQVISSLAFGTRAGRFASLFLAIPFGGAVVIVVGIHHLLGVFTGAHDHSVPRKLDVVRFNGERDEDAAEEDTANVDGNVTASTVGEEGLEPNFVDPPMDNSSGAADNLSAADVTDDEQRPVDGPLSDKQFDVDTDAAAFVETTESTRIEREPNAAYQWVGDQTVALSVTVGFLLMALINLPAFRSVFWNITRYVWSGVRTAIYDIPISILRLPLLREVWRSRWFVRVRRNVTTPLLIAWTGCRFLPYVFSREPQDWWFVAAVALLLSFAANSRLGRDAEELTAEWLANAWYDLRSRFLMALLDWIIDFFKWLLNLLERFIYAVDEWLRFHSGETWFTVVLKAVLGVVWSFVSFLLRIYVNLLIEPTLHPVKHFPVVTVAHKIFLPVILIIEQYMRSALTPYLGVALAGPITWFNIVFLPGIFGFLVWELKENWRLYASNRVPSLQPVVIGSHGENGGRLLKRGFHSGTLPKLFTQLRRLERKEPSFHRFSRRRALRESLEHTERDIRRFVERDLVRLLEYCSVWKDSPITCRRVYAASNSFLVQLCCETHGGEPLELLFQEQSGWLVATIAKHGWLDSVNPAMFNSFETAVGGFYRKACVDLVREQMERSLIGGHPYDVCSTGLLIWPDRQFDKEVSLDLHRRHQIRPVPAHRAGGYGLLPVSRESFVFSASRTLWINWQIYADLWPRRTRKCL